MITQFSITSPTIHENGAIPLRHIGNQYGCPGENVSPALSWSGAPEGTKSYAITFFDHDAQTGSGFWHWVAYNIPASVIKMEEGASAGRLPAGTVEGNTDLGKPGWFGPGPMDGKEHRYTYTVYALKTEALDIPPGATAAFAGFFIIQNALAKATLTGKVHLKS
jgi:Raf kinase inhibitor-like YbhB/YbcL family protein